MFLSDCACVYKKQFRSAAQKPAPAHPGPTAPSAGLTSGPGASPGAASVGSSRLKELKDKLAVSAKLQQEVAAVTPVHPALFAPSKVPMLLHANQAPRVGGQAAAALQRLQGVGCSFRCVELRRKEVR